MSNRDHDDEVQAAFNRRMDGIHDFLIAIGNSREHADAKVDILHKHLNKAHQHTPNDAIDSEILNLFVLAEMRRFARINHARSASATISSPPVNLLEAILRVILGANECDALLGDLTERYTK